MSTAKTNAERQAAFKARRIKQGLVRRPVWATPEEHEKIKTYLHKLRKRKDVLR